MESPTVLEHRQMAVNNVLRCLFSMRICDGSTRSHTEAERRIINVNRRVAHFECSIRVFHGSLGSHCFHKKIEWNVRQVSDCRCLRYSHTYTYTVRETDRQSKCLELVFPEFFANMLGDYVCALWYRKMLNRVILIWAERIKQRFVLICVSIGRRCRRHRRRRHRHPLLCNGSLSYVDLHFSKNSGTRESNGTRFYCILEIAYIGYTRTENGMAIDALHFIYETALPA